jgi:DNA mismatch endonuclease, patch repair protein
LKPASAKASTIARMAARKADTRCELLLRRELWRRGLRYRLHLADLPGRPDIVFPKNRIVVFCDGDFWHGRDIDARVAKLAAGHNSAYWIAKVRRNVERDREQSNWLTAVGWTVLRFWETDILRNTSETASIVVSALALLSNRL